MILQPIPSEFPYICGPEKSGGENRLAGRSPSLQVPHWTYWFRLTTIQGRHSVLTYVKYRSVSGSFQNIDPPPPSPPSECVLRAVRGGGSILWKTPDILLASYSIISLYQGRARRRQAAGEHGLSVQFSRTDPRKYSFARTAGGSKNFPKQWTFQVLTE